jgi:hypothetical protein
VCTDCWQDANLDVLAEESVEEVYVGGPEVDEVLEFLEGRRLHGQEAEAYGNMSNCTLSAGNVLTHIDPFAHRSSRQLGE